MWPPDSSCHLLNMSEVELELFKQLVAWVPPLRFSTLSRTWKLAMRRIKVMCVKLWMLCVIKINSTRLGHAWHVFCMHFDATPINAPSSTAHHSPRTNSVAEQNAHKICIHCWHVHAHKGISKDILGYVCKGWATAIACGASSAEMLQQWMQYILPQNGYSVSQTGVNEANKFSQCHIRSQCQC